MAHQVGCRNTVATCGTALTDFHLKILGRYVQNLILCFDMDFAGESATERGINLALSRGFDLKIARLPEGKDPADLIKEDPRLWQETIEKAIPIMEFYFKIAFSKFDKESLKGKKEISQFLLPIIKKIPNKIEQGFWIQRLSKELKLDEKYIYEELKKIETQEIRFKKEEVSVSPKNKKSKQEILEEEILKIILSHPNLFEKIDKEILNIVSPLSSSILRKIEKIYQKEKEVQDWNQYSKQFSDEELEKMNILLLEYEVEREKSSEKESEQDIEDVLEENLIAYQKELIKSHLKERLKGIVDEIKVAEEENNQEKVSLLLKEFHSLRKKIEKLNS
jgi:DNA primase